MNRLLLLLLCILLPNFHPARGADQTPGAKATPNVLFIAIGDLRDWVGYLGDKQVKTPNLDRLAARGVAFTRGFCASPCCNPSRTALCTGLKCVRMQLGEPDASGRARPIVIPGSEFVVPCDVVVVAIGTRANPLLTATCPDLKLNKWGNIIVDDKCMTNLPGVFAGGDIVRGAATVILAMGDGKRAAKAMDEYLRSLA